MKSLWNKKKMIVNCTVQAVNENQLILENSKWNNIAAI